MVTVQLGQGITRTVDTGPYFQLQVAYSGFRDGNHIQFVDPQGAVLYETSVASELPFNVQVNPGQRYSIQIMASASYMAGPLSVNPYSE